MEAPRPLGEAHNAKDVQLDMQNLELARTGG